MIKSLKWNSARRFQLQIDQKFLNIETKQTNKKRDTHRVWIFSVQKWIVHWNVDVGKRWSEYFRYTHLTRTIGIAYSRPN